MNYRFRQAVLGFARQTNWTDASGTIPALRPSQAAHSLQAILEDYPRQAAAVSFNLIDSHDTNRALFVLDGDVQGQRLAALLQFTSFGAPMIYYGDEAGIDAPAKGGFGDPYNRAPYPWPDASGNVDTYGPPDLGLNAYYKKLAELRHSLPALATGSFVPLFTDASVLAFVRVAAPSKPVLVVLNKGDQPDAVTIPVRGHFPNGAALEDALLGSRASVSGGSTRVNVSPRTGLILVGTS
jgi:glycosidase